MKTRRAGKKNFSRALTDERAIQEHVRTCGRPVTALELSALRKSKLRIRQGEKLQELYKSMKSN